MTIGAHHHLCQVGLNLSGESSILLRNLGACQQQAGCKNAHALKINRDALILPFVLP